MADAYFLLRHLDIGKSGLGQIVHSISAHEELSIEEYRELYPDVFQKEGFYSLLVNTNRTWTKDANRKKKKRDD